MRRRADTHTISDLQQIKALADPLRQRILGAFVKEPRTTKQVATLLDQPPTKLYHHVDLLARVGLIKLVSTKPKRGTTEKYFRAIANRFTVSQTSLGGEAGSVVEEAFAKAFAEAQTEIRSGIRAGGGNPEDGQTVMALGMLRLAKEDLPKIARRIADIAQELKSDPSKREPYRYLVAVFPTATPTGRNRSGASRRPARRA